MRAEPGVLAARLFGQWCRPRLLRSSSFRLTLVYAAIFCLSFIALFGTILALGRTFMTHQTDLSVSNELAEINTDLAAAGGGTTALRQVVQMLTASSPGYFYLLQDQNGQVLAGNLSPMRPIAGLREWPSADQHHPRPALRGRGVAMPGGQYLFVGVSALELHQMQTLLTRAFFWGLAATLVLALAGGTLTSLIVLRRVEAVSRTSREIMAGDLHRRMALRGTDDEFDHLAGSLNAMLDRISGLLDGLRHVSDDIAHDLRTPLNHLRQRLEGALRRSTDIAAFRAVIEASLGDIDAILATFGALLRIAQIESGGRRAGFAALDLCAMLENLAEIYQPVAEAAGQTLLAELPGALHLRGDPELLTQLFANLIENSIRHTPPGTTLRLSAAQDGVAVLACVADDGPGIPAEQRQRVLQRFARLEASRTRPGSGLGLALVAAIAGLHGARLVLAESCAGATAPGLAVRLIFPTL